MESLWPNRKLRLVITPQCNISCFYCHNEGQPRALGFMDFATLVEIERLARSCADPPKAVTISGGEPLLHPRLAEMVEFTSGNLTSNVSVVTNGLLLNLRDLTKLNESGLSTLRLGIDSLEPARSRPSPGRLEGPTHWALLVSQAKLLGLRVEINLVLSRFNRTRYGDVIRLALDEGVSIKCFELVDARSLVIRGVLGSISSQPQVPLEHFATTLNRIDADLQLAIDPCYGAANLVARRSDGVEVRYCRYLCDFGLCWKSGARIDGRNRVYTCMNSAPRESGVGSIGPALQSLDWDCPPAYARAHLVGAVKGPGQ